MTVKMVLDELAAKINNNPDGIQGVNLVYEFDLSGDDGGIFQIKFEEGSVHYVEGNTYEPACKLQLSDKNFIKLVSGDLNPTTAFMMGKLKVKGDISLALKLQSIFNKYK